MYPEKLLASGETIAFEIKPHFRALIWPATVLIIAVFIGTWAFFLTDNSIIRWIIVGAAAFILIWQVARPFLGWLSTQYVFTSRRIIVRRGLLTKQGRDMPLAKVNNVSFEVGVIGRILNYGTLQIESASDDGDLVINDVPNVENIQRQVYEIHELDDSRRRGSGSAPE